MPKLTGIGFPPGFSLSWEYDNDFPNVQCVY